MSRGSLALIIPQAPAGQLRISTPSSPWRAVGRTPQRVRETARADNEPAYRAADSPLTRGDLLTASGDSGIALLDAVSGVTAAGAAAGPLPDTAASLAADYLLDEDENRRALSAILGSLAGETGRGFLISGGRGSGKSHFLCLLALLAGAPRAWTPFLESHPGYSLLSRRFLPGSGDAASGPLLVVPLTLENHRADGTELEDLVFDAASQALAALPGWDVHGLDSASFTLRMAESHLLPLHADRFLEWIEERSAGPGGADSAERWECLKRDDPRAAAEGVIEFAERAGIAVPWQEARRERLHRLLELARSSGRRGVVFLLDELSLYLQGAEGPRFARDVSFLQFAGQQSRHYPLWIVASTRQGIEETGDIDGETLRKLRDRYTCGLALSMAQMRPVLAKKAVIRRRPEMFAARMQEIWSQREESGDLAGIGPDELAEIYPLHPLTMECLAAASGQFFSQARGVIRFVQSAVTEGAHRPAAELVGPDEVLDWYWPSALEYPELRPVVEAVRYYHQNIARIVPKDPEYALRLVRALAALALAGLRRTVREVAAALPVSSCPGAAAAPSPLEYVREVLEMLRDGGGYIDVCRSASGDEVYFFDPACDLARRIRGKLAVFSAGLKDGDRRIRAAVYEAADEGALPLNALAQGVRVEVEWLHARHTAHLSRQDLEQWSPADAAGEIAWLADSRQPETLRILVAELSDPERQRDRFVQALRLCPADRWRPAVLAWIPRALRDEEHQALREYAAFRALMADPTLRHSRVGRQILERLQSGHTVRTQKVRDIAHAAYREGDLIGADGSVATPADLRRVSGQLDDIVSLAGSRVLPHIFDEYPSLAPRRSPSDENIRTLLDQLVMSGGARPAPGSPLEGLIRDFAMPLGIVRVHGHEYTLQPPAGPLADAILAAVPEGEQTGWSTLAARLTKSRFGVSQAQLELLVTVLCRTGHLAPCTRDGAAFCLHTAAMPLSAHAHSLRRGDTIGSDLAARLDLLARSLESPCAHGNPEAARAVWDRILEIRADLESFLAHDHIAALAPRLGCGIEQWACAASAVDELRSLLSAVDPAGHPTAEIGRFLAAADEDRLERLGSLYSGWRALQRFLTDEGPRLAGAVSYLSRPELARLPNEELAQRIHRFVRAVSAGESLLPRSPEAARCGETLLRRYREQYLEWHLETFGSARFAPYRALRSAPGWAALQQLERLPLGVSGFPGVEALVEEALSLQCPAAGLTSSLLRSPVCPSCQLPVGAVIPLVPLEDIRARLCEALSDVLRELAEPGRLSRIRRHAEQRLDPQENRAAALLGLCRFLESERPPVDADLRMLDQLLDEPLVRELRKALSAGEPVRRNLDSLLASLTSREVTRAEAVRLFVSWLDPDGSLEPEQFFLILEGGGHEIPEAGAGAHVGVPVGAQAEDRAPLQDRIQL